MQSSDYSEEERALLKTILYGDIFDFPLTLLELKKYLISSQSFPINHSIKKLYLKNVIDIQNGFYFLKGKDHLVKKRLERQKISLHKMNLLPSIITILGKIPTVKLIALSGNLAVKNAQKTDDIDLFFITEKNKLWLTRFLVVLILQTYGKRRKRGDIDTTDKICANMFMDETQLVLDKQDLYAAHEAAQMIPLIDKNNTYQKFLNSNKWIKNILPNAFLYTSQISQLNIQNHSSRYFRIIEGFILDFLESLAKYMQVWYMKSHVTEEVISDTLLAFHPFNYRKKILTEYHKRLKQYKIE